MAHGGRSSRWGSWTCHPRGYVCVTSPGSAGVKVFDPQWKSCLTHSQHGAIMFCTCEGAEVAQYRRHPRGVGRVHVHRVADEMRLVWCDVPRL